MVKDETAEQREARLRTAREAKRRRKGECVDCGKPTSYSGALGKPVSERCASCAAQKNAAKFRGKGPKQTLVVEYLEKNGTIKFSEIATVAGIKQEATGQMVVRMVRGGIIEKTSRGVYRLTERSGDDA